MKQEEIQKNTMHQECADIKSIPFKRYAEHFHIIESKTVSVVVARDEQSREMVEEIKIFKACNPRKLQNYTCTVYPRELEDLLRQHAVNDFGSGIFCLDNQDYYDDEIGILFEAKDYYIDI